MSDAGAAGGPGGVPRPAARETVLLGTLAALLVIGLLMLAPRAAGPRPITPVAVFVLVGSAWGVFEARRSIDPRGRDTDRGTRRLVIVSFFGILAASVAEYAILPGVLPRGGGFAVLGGGMMAAGLAIRVRALRTLGHHFTHRLVVPHDQRLVERGPYRYIRHPGYVGEILLFLGSAVCWSSVLGLLAAAAALAAFGRRVVVEERLLGNAFGESYERYARSRGRFVPRRDAVRALLGAGVDAVIAHAWLVLAAVAVLSAVFGWGLARLAIKFDMDQMFPRGHPFVEVDRTVRRVFGGRHFVAIMVQSRDGSVWNPAPLELVQTVTEDLRLMPGVIQHDIMSLASPNARWFGEGGGDLRVEYVMRDVPPDAAAIRALRDRVVVHPLYGGRLVSADERAALVSADFYDDVPEPEISRALERLIARRADPCCDLYLTGMPVLVETVNSYVTNMWPRFALAFATIAAVLYASFGSWQGVVVPLLTGGLSAFWAMGLASYLGLTVDMFNNMAPVLVLAIGAGHSGQMLKRYYEEVASLRDNRAAVRSATVKMAPVMLAAGFTAAAGFASLLLFRLPSLRTFGLVTATGIAWAVVLEMTFVPALRSLLPVREARALRGAGPGRLDGLLAGVGHAVYGHPIPFVAAGALLVVGGFAAALRMPSSYSLPDYLPPSSVGRRHLDAVRAEFPGTVPLIILLEGPGGFGSEPATVAFVRGLETALTGDRAVVFTASYVDALRQAHSALTGEPYGTLPDTREGLAQILYLAYSDQLARFLSRDQRQIAVWAFLNVYETSTVSRVLAVAEGYRAAHPLPGVRIQIAGGAAPLEVALNEETVRGKVLNVGVVLFVIFVVASLMLRSPLAGICVLTPLLVTVAMTFGVLGLLRVPLDLVSATIAAISVGIGADYAIYLLLRLIEERRTSPDVETALVRALQTSGKAILFVAAAISAGYATLGVSEFPPFRLTALLVPMTMAISCLAAMTVMLGLVVALRTADVPRDAV